MLKFKRRSGLILMYHRINTIDVDPWNNCVSPGHFQEHLAVLQKYPDLLKLKIKDLRSFLDKDGPVQASVMTFDDGYADSLTHAKPLLEQSGMPGTFFIVPGAIEGKKEFWWDELERVVLGASQVPDKAVLGIQCLDRRVFCRSLAEKLRPLPSQAREDVLHELKDLLQDKTNQRKRYLPLDLQGLRQLADSNLVEIGAHTMTHPMLSRLPLEEQHNEIKESKRQLEEKLGQKIVSFSYPFGDYSKQTVKSVKEAGFSYSCTVKEQSITGDPDLFQLPRYQVLDWNGRQFEEHLLTWLGN